MFRKINRNRLYHIYRKEEQQHSLCHQLISLWHRGSTHWTHCILLKHIDWIQCEILFAGIHCLEFFPRLFAIIMPLLFFFFCCFSISPVDNPVIPPCLILPWTLLLDCMGVLSPLIDWLCLSVPFCLCGWGVKALKRGIRSRFASHNSALRWLTSC